VTDGLVEAGEHLDLGVVVGVEVDEARRDPRAVGLDDLGARRIERGRQRGDDAPLEQHVEPLPRAAAPVEDGSTLHEYSGRSVEHA
jgi:hypothetical protein